MLNRVEIIGNVGRRPVLRHTNKGSAVCNIDIAVHRLKSNTENGGKYETDWVEITAFEGLARFCAERLLKGVKVFVEGRLQTEPYEKNGLRVFRTRVIVNKVILLSPKEEGDSVARAEGGDSLGVD